MARTAIVVGGGIGGLAAALGLRRAGFEVTVHERAPELREVGAGLSLWSNAVKALRRLGVADAALAAGATFERATTLDARGRELSDVRLGELARRAGEPSLGLHRADLQRLLADALGRERVRLGSACVAVRDEGTRAVVELEEVGGGRRTEAADVVIGADGLRRARVAPGAGPCADALDVVRAARSFARSRTSWRAKRASCMDTVVLADALARAADPAAGLRAYEEARRGRTRFVIETSWRLGRLFQAEWAPLVWLRDRGSSTAFGRRQATLERLLLHDLPELPPA